MCQSRRAARLALRAAFSSRHDSNCPFLARHAVAADGHEPIGTAHLRLRLDGFSSVKPIKGSVTPNPCRPLDVSWIGQRSVILVASTIGSITI